MDTNDTTLSDESIQSSCDEITAAHNKLDEILADIRDCISEAILDDACERRPVNRSTVLAQIIMEALNDGGVSELGHDAVFKGRYDKDMKVHLVEMADQMGPDYAQALYHAAVFITKVA